MKPSVGEEKANGKSFYHQEKKEGGGRREGRRDKGGKGGERT